MTRPTPGFAGPARCIETSPYPSPNGRRNRADPLSPGVDFDPAADRVIALDLVERRHLGGALVHGERAARREGTARTERGEVGRRAFDRREVCVGVAVEARDRAEQAEGV